MSWRDIAVPTWCKCRKCCKTSKAEENVCCGEAACRSDKFAKENMSTLTKEYLELKLSEDEEKNRKLSDMGLSHMGKLRRLCYEEASAFFHAQQWYPQDDPSNEKYLALPSCIVWTIRREYEEEGEGTYTGFPPKTELLQEVVDAHKKFKDDMKESKKVVELANPDRGLLAKLQTFGVGNLCDILTESDVNSSCADWKQQAEQWQDSITKSIHSLPKLGFVACATTFETFVHDATRRCVDAVFPTRTIVESDEQYWTHQFQKWMKTRVSESYYWDKEDHELEISFWCELIPSICTRSETPQQCSTATLEKIKESSTEVISELLRKRTSQSAVGLVQEIVNAKKQKILANLTKPTWECISETFSALVNEQSQVTSDVQVTQQEESCPRPAKQLKTSVEHAMHLTFSPLQASTPMEEETSKSTGYRRTKRFPGKLSLRKSTPKKTSTISKSPRKLSSKTSERKTSPKLCVQAIPKLAKRYADKYTWKISLNVPESPDIMTRYTVKCKEPSNLYYLTELFYGLRCIFSHGTPEKTIEFGSLRKDRTPTKSSHFGIQVLKSPDKEDPSKPRENCESYLYEVAMDAVKKTNEMHVSHNLFLTVSSFYAYMTKIIGGVGACVACKCSDSKLMEKSTKAHHLDLAEIKEIIKDAWGSEEISASTASAMQSTSIADAVEDEGMCEESGIYTMSESGVTEISRVDTSANANDISPPSSLEMDLLFSTPPQTGGENATEMSSESCDNTSVNLTESSSTRLTPDIANLMATQQYKIG